ncbi:GNAT family N-acetyltransferase [Butyrivibrio sp. MC2013]|uniref:GNAT family N-acetyltransferase n=1 Tax=Butyrivibrio sp. MC2013 TaxID=1280686 RepID=UPI00040A40BF|nr:GNAT family N-acetyltransferase [Butyrivibrio sp. MC2013]
MKIRRAVNADIPKLLDLLSQVLEIHAAIRPDIFRSGTTKYTKDELTGIIANDNTPVYVAADDDDTLMGYAFCVIKSPAFTSTMHPKSQLYIDDLCVDEKYRDRHIGRSLFEHVLAEGKRLGCYEVTLSVWAGNDAAELFYEKMGMKTKSRIMEYIL